MKVVPVIAGVMIAGVVWVLIDPAGAAETLVLVSMIGAAAFLLAGIVETVRWARRRQPVGR